MIIDNVDDFSCAATVSYTQDKESAFKVKQLMQILGCDSLFKTDKIPRLFTGKNDKINTIQASQLNPMGVTLYLKWGRTFLCWIHSILKMSLAESK